MKAVYHIRHLKRQEIDITAWDACICESPAGLLYARSFFLDTVSSGHWDALVMGEYEAVMPLIWNKKFGFTYLYQPHFVPALGVFNKGTSPAPLTAFLSSIPGKFRFWDIDCNEHNILSADIWRLIKHTSRSNYLLPLNHSGQQIRQGYKRLAKRMLQKAHDAGLKIIRNVDPVEVIDHFRKEYNSRLPHISERAYRRITDCARLGQTEGLTATYMAKQPDGQVVAVYLVLRDDKFVYSVLGGSTSAGKENGAFYLLTDTVLQDHCDTDRVFRFEGSDVPGIAFFNAQFGSQPVTYLHLLVNRLPFPINLLKNK